jgi:hypothetical protein
MQLSSGKMAPEIIARQNIQLPSQVPRTSEVRGTQFVGIIDVDGLGMVEFPRC